MKTRYLKDVVTLKLNEDKCTGCGLCLDVCPHEVLAIEDRKVKIVDRDACMECGACAMNCPFEAIAVKAGVGCAAAIMRSILYGGEPTCGCSGDDNNGGCC
ncbi:MAG: mercury methylation ferredoxin HgcB [Candidatus Saccharibacteria bacterium]